MKVLAQLSIPGYKDVPGGIYNNFVAKFTPNNPSSSLASLVSRLLAYAIIVAGLLFFAKLLMAGFSYLTSAGDSGKVAAATKNITNAALGLFVVICAFFIAQILQGVFGIQIL
jgi:hypothetical protein